MTATSPIESLVSQGDLLPAKPAQTAAAKPADSSVHYWAADAKTSYINWFADKHDALPAGSLKNPTHDGYPLVFRVLKIQAKWAQVQLPMRPNGATGWVRLKWLNLREVPNAIVINTTSRALSVWSNTGHMIFFAPVAVGRASSPTPLGEFYIDGLIKPPTSGGAYGVLIMSVAAFSDVYQTFAGGPGQIAIHGTNAPQYMGQAVSHGCVRMTNENILKLRDLAPPGTPVFIMQD